MRALVVVAFALAGCKSGASGPPKPDVAPAAAGASASASMAAAPPTAPASASASAIADAATGDAGTVGVYKFRTYDGYEVTTVAGTDPIVVFVWSKRCSTCAAMREAAEAISKDLPRPMYLAISRDDDASWHKAVGSGSALVDVRDATGRFVRDTAAVDGTILLLTPARAIAWRGEWREADAEALERRIGAL